jgi:hypothetical protein
MSGAAVSRKAQRTMLALGDEAQNFRDRGVLGRQRLHLAQPLGENAGSIKQLLIERPYDGQSFARELATLHADDVETLEAGILAVDEPERDHVAANAADAADHHLRPDPGELMHRGQPAYENKIADLAVATERGRGRKDHVIADLAVMTDMATVHKISAIADAGNTAPTDGAGVHGHLLPDGAALADLKPGELAAIAQRLRRRAERNEWIDRAAIADHGLRRDMHMSDQLAVRADDGVGADDAVGTDRCALADHSAILNPRGGIDRAHRKARYQPMSLHVNLFDFQWLARVADTV